MEEKMKERVNGEILSYDEYIQFVEKLVDEGKTSGNNQSESLVNFTALNLKRMLRIYKTTKIEDAIYELVIGITQPQVWYVITEAWCGDSAQNLPIIAKIAVLSKGIIDLQIIFRDENPALMNVYTTNGSKSIPKVIGFNENSDEMFTWGPRPEEAQRLLFNWKVNPEGKSWDEFEKELHTWYAKDKGQNIQKEFLLILNKLSSTY